MPLLLGVARCRCSAGSGALGFSSSGRNVGKVPRRLGKCCPTIGLRKSLAGGSRRQNWRGALLGRGLELLALDLVDESSLGENELSFLLRIADVIGLSISVGSCFVIGGVRHRRSGRRRGFGRGASSAGDVDVVSLHEAVPSCFGDAVVIGRRRRRSMLAAAFCSAGAGRAAATELPARGELNGSSEVESVSALANAAGLGSRQAAGDVDVARLLSLTVEQARSSERSLRLPLSEGPLHYVSPKVERRALGESRGRGVVALKNLEAGELLISARPLGLVLPDDGEVGADLSEASMRALLAAQLEARVTQDVSVAADVFSLYDGSGQYGIVLASTLLHSSSRSLSNLSRPRIERIIRFNAHRCPGGRDLVTGRPTSGLGLWLWPPMVNHALEADEPPNCAHVFFGDVMVFRTTRPVRAGQELLDRYTSPLQPVFEPSLVILKDHGMQDATYEAQATAWAHAEVGDTSPSLTPGQQALAATLGRLERALASGAVALAAVPLVEYIELREAYGKAAAEAARGQTRLPLAPAEVRALDLLSPLAAAWEGRPAMLEVRAEMARRVQAARPFHMSAVGLWAELHSRMGVLPRSSLVPREALLAAEVEQRLREAAAFWLSGPAPDDRELAETFLPWALEVVGFRFGWFSKISVDRLQQLPVDRGLRES